MFSILLVDDDEVDVMNVRRAFRKNNIMHPITVATNGIEALEILRSHEIPIRHCLILLDLNMPRMGGIEFLQELRADPHLKTMPVVVLTTSADSQDQNDAYELHVAGYLLKPVTFGDFVELMNTLSRYWSLNQML